MPKKAIKTAPYKRCEECTGGRVASAAACIPCVSWRKDNFKAQKKVNIKKIRKKWLTKLGISAKLEY